MKELDLNKLKAAIANADSFQKHLIQEGVKTLLFDRQSVSLLLRKFLADCNIFKDSKILPDKLKDNHNIDAVVELNKILTTKLNKKSTGAHEVELKGFENNPNFFGTEGDWYNLTLGTIIDKIVYEPFVNYKKLYNVIITHSDNAWIFEKLNCFNVDTYIASDSVESKDFLYLGRYGTKCHILISASEEVKNKFLFYNSNNLGNIALKDVEFSDFYSSIELIDKKN